MTLLMLAQSQFLNWTTMAENAFGVWEELTIDHIASMWALRIIGEYDEAYT